MGGTFKARDPLRPAAIGTFELENDEIRFLQTLLALLNGAPLTLQDLAADAERRMWRTRRRGRPRRVGVVP